jgi:hypothetical protein
MPAYRRWLLAAFGFLFLAGPAPAADLSKIDRTIVKEPAYQNKPGYCLLVFGPEAKTRAWLVRDGKTLYIDRNGNGDLTEPGKQLSARPGDAQGAIADASGKTKYVIRYSNLTRVGGDKEFCHISIDVDGDYRQYSFAGFADRPQDAPVVHFDGPLTVEVADKDLVLARGDKATDFGVYMLTRGHGERLGSTVLVDYGLGVPVGAEPVVDIEFPGKEPGGKPVLAKYTLKQRC